MVTSHAARRADAADGWGPRRSRRRCRRACPLGKNLVHLFATTSVWIRKCRCRSRPIRRFASPSISLISVASGIGIPSCESCSSASAKIHMGQLTLPIIVAVWSPASPPYDALNRALSWQRYPFFFQTGSAFFLHQLYPNNDELHAVSKIPHKCGDVFKSTIGISGAYLFFGRCAAHAVGEKLSSGERVLPRRSFVSITASTASTRHS